MMDLILYKNFPINDYENQVYYADNDERNRVFDTYKDREFKDLSSCDKTKQQIRLNIDYYVGNKYNYGCIREHYKNKDGTETIKRYYIFINVVEWLSNNTVVLHYTYDYWQSYCYDVAFKPSFVEREHVSNDTFGLHLLDEGLPISDYIIQGNTNIDYKASDICFCLTLSDNEYVRQVADQSQRMSLYWDYGTGISLLTLCFDDFEYAMKTIEILVGNNKIDSIQGFFVAPTKDNRTPCVIAKDDTSAPDIPSGAFVCLPNDDYKVETMTNITAFEGYVPNNKKCFIYPYSFVNITNYLGASIKGKYEFANDKNTIKFRYNFPNVEGGAPNGYLYEYDGLTHALDYNISGFVNPELPFVTNQFSAYLSANANSINNTKSYIEKDATHGIANASIDYAQSGINSIISIAKGDVVGGLQSVFNSSTDYIQNANDIMYNRQKARDSINASLSDQASKGDIAHGCFNPTTLTNIGRCGFQMQKCRVTRECITTIDHYFSMFGYKVNIIKQPQFNSRKRWNYIKTSGVNVIGNIPQDALTVIKEMFNGGTTIWHSAQKGFMYNYDFDDNGIVRTGI